MTQESLLEVVSDVQGKFERLLRDVQLSARRIVEELEYPDGCVGMAVNRNQTETNYVLQVRERRRSAAESGGNGDGELAVLDGDGARLSYVCSTICTLALPKSRSRLSGCVEIRLSVPLFRAVKVPPSEAVKERYTKQSGSTDEKALSRCDVFMDLDSADILPYLEDLIRYRLVNYKSTEPTYGCCHLYKDCSDAGKCVSGDKIYATACSYRKNLEAGRVFYGRNRNIDA